MSSSRERYGRKGRDSDVDSDYESSSARNPRERSSKAASLTDEHRPKRRDNDKSYRKRDHNDSDGDRSVRRKRYEGEDARGDRRRRYHRDRSVSDSPDADRSSKREQKYRERSRSRDQTRSHYRHARSRSPPSKKRRSLSRSRSPPPQRSRGPLLSQEESFTGQLPPGEKPVEKQKPNFKPTGLLAKEANTVAGTTTVLKYHEPPEARKPSSKEPWRLYVFKKKDLLDTVYLHQRSVWLMGRDQKVTDLLLEHPSISKQHAVIQFRHITTTNEYGDRSSKVKPYLIDLESANGTKLNGKKVEASRFIELVDQDVMSFGDSEREYVMMLPSAQK